MSREYQRSTAKVANRVFSLKKIREEEPEIGFFITRVVRGWKTAYNADLRSWTTPLEGTRFLSYELAYRVMRTIANFNVGEYKVVTLRDLKNELW